jgi:hypothetical protein
MELLYSSMVIFGIAALIGVYLISHVLQNKFPPKGVALTHGGLAATALVLLIVFIYNTGADLIQAVALFVIVALGGVIMFIRHLKGKNIPKGLAIAHGLLAIIGFIFLLAYTYSNNT